MKYLFVILSFLSLFFSSVSGKRLIVQLSVPPLARHPNYATLRHQHVNARSANGDEISDVLGPLRELVTQQQNTFLSSIPARWSVATFHTERGTKPAAVHRVLNAITIKVPDAEANYAKRVISRMPGVVSVFEDQKFSLKLHTSYKAINAADAWSALNSTERDAGRGVKIAIVDTGVYTKNSMFSDDGMELPEGSYYPQGQTSNTNKKVIVSRIFVDPDDPPNAYDTNTYPSTSSSMHGIHCASSAAGSFTTVSKGPRLNLTGIAPGAWLMNYRIFYMNGDGDIISTSTSMILEAFDTLTADGADVASNSWGAFPFQTKENPIDLAVKEMVEAGVTTVFAAGNDGPITLTVDRYSPAIRVGATTSGSGIGYYVMKLSPSVGYNIEYMNSKTTYSSVTETYTLYGPEEDDELACSPLKRSFSGNAAVVALRGTCTFVEKINNIAKAGAKLAIIGNNREGGPDLVYMGTDGTSINSVFIGHEPAINLINLTKTSGSQVNITLSESFTGEVVSVEKDM